jgi:hypothetical protein
MKARKRRSSPFLEVRETPVTKFLNTAIFHTGLMQIWLISGKFGPISKILVTKS